MATAPADPRVVSAIRVERPRLRAAAAGLPAAERDEMAVPSYCHPNPAIRWLFWSRLDAALRLAGVRAGERVLDFGTGAGVLLPSLTAAGAVVTATDVQLGPARALVDARGLDVELLAAEAQDGWFDVHRGTVGCVFALDVLEHVSDQALPRLVERFRDLLGRGGRLVVSGPTESLMYAVGRFVAGFRHVEYHHRNVFDLDAAIRTAFAPGARVRLPPWPLPRAFLVSRYEPRRA